VMSQRDLREGIPKNQQALKNHPVFAIQTQLRQDEVIFPLREVGTMYGKDKKLIPVFRRTDVKTVKTAQQWYMIGREVKSGEQPLKLKPKRKSRRNRAQDDVLADFQDDYEDADEEVGMYAEFQTIAYVPPPVIFGVVPKNDYGNLDVYVPSMVPRGGAHIPHKLAVKAAQILMVDYADAVTGFEFRGRGNSTPIIKGIVAAAEYREAIETTIRGFEDEAAEEAVAKKELEMLKLWRKFLIALRIKERVDEYGPIEENNSAKGKQRAFQDIDENESEDEGEGGFMKGDENYNEQGNAGGGFFTDELEQLAGETMRSAPLDNKDVRKKIGLKFLDERPQGEEPQMYNPEDYAAGGFFLGEDSGNVEMETDTGGGFMTEEDSTKGKRKEREIEDTGGGFLVESPTKHGESDEEMVDILENDVEEEAISDDDIEEDDFEYDDEF